ncbi:hypothetical protein [Streptomyces bambusae]|uniref:DUF8017 domain-containing protein n=1 Tax=Streptomyces bambusae TaxID=1550616 RepID=A0ABS6ZB96_9ACTN|nr:hypothetical protein [Streptomyces bambusae]MBW5485039.1 hypothetical protein [Streptomyces bambusae]
MHNPPDHSHNPYPQQGYGPAPQGRAGGPYPPEPATLYPEGEGGTPRRTPDQDRRRTVVVALCAGAAVLATAAATGVVVLRHQGGDGPAPAASGASPSGSASPARPGTSKPLVAGWKTVVNPAHGTAFDVPPDWEVLAPSVFSGFTDHKDANKVLVGHSAPAFYKSKWCSIDANGDGHVEDVRLGSAGTKGADGAKDTAEVAEKTAPTWVYAAYSQPDKSVVKWDKPVDYTTKAGVKGSYVKARSEGVPQSNRCAGDGQAVVFGFRNSKGGFVAWNFYGRTGVSGAVADDLIMKIMSTVRLAGDPVEPTPLP